MLVAFHGGPSATAQPRTAFFLSLDYVVVEPNVRGSGGFGRSFEQADNRAGRLDAFPDIEANLRT